MKEKYTIENAQNEAERMQKKVESKRAENYKEAEEQITIEDENRAEYSRMLDRYFEKNPGSEKKMDEIIGRLQVEKQLKDGPRGFSERVEINNVVIIGEWDFRHHYILDIPQMYDLAKESYSPLRVDPVDIGEDPEIAKKVFGFAAEQLKKINLKNIDARDDLRELDEFQKKVWDFYHDLAEKKKKEDEIMWSNK